MLMVNHCEIFLPLWNTFSNSRQCSCRHHGELKMSKNTSEMMKQLLFLVINFILLSNFCESRIFDSATINTSTCKGSLVFKQGNGKLLTLSGDMNVTKIYVESVSMKGCGCYQVFSGRYCKVWFIPSQLKQAYMAYKSRLNMKLKFID